MHQFIIIIINVLELLQISLKVINIQIIILLRDVQFGFLSFLFKSNHGELMYDRHPSFELRQMI